MYYIYILIMLCIVGMLYMYYNRKVPMQSYKDFRVNEVHSILSKEECDNIINFIDTDDKSKYKAYNNMKWRILEDGEMQRSVFVKLNREIKKLFKNRIPEEYHIDNFELAEYDPGNRCEYHYDTCNGYVRYCNQFDEQFGPKRITVLIYLNDEFEGGETTFNWIKTSVKPETGKMLWFDNYNGEDVIAETEHCGETVRAGKKYICLTWIRFK